MLKITDVRVYPIKSKKTSTKAFASITFDKAFVVTGIRVVKGEKGLFVSMPQVKNKDGEYKDTAFPLSKELREAINEAVIKAYEED